MDKEINYGSLWLGLLVALCCLIPFMFDYSNIAPSTDLKDEKDGTTIFLVRHADRMESEDALTPLGIQRAEDLKKFLINKNIDIIFSSDFNRTKQTARPLSKAIGKKPKIYDASDMPALIKKIKDNHRGQNILIVGHSNTTPEAANLFGAKPRVANIDHNTYKKIMN